MEFLSQPSPQQHDDQTGNLRELMIIDTKKSGEVVQIQMHHDQEEETNMTSNKKCYMFLLGINYMLLFVGSISSSLISKFYLNHKGYSRWVSTWANLLDSLFYCFLFTYLSMSLNQLIENHLQISLLKSCYSACIGFLVGLNNLLLSWGNYYLPVSTNSLLLSSQLAFTLITSVIIVGQKVTLANLNCVILLTLSSVLLALDSSHDKSKDLTRTKYFIGFFSTIGGGLLFTLYLSLMEKIYKKASCYYMVLEMQMVIELATMILATLGMIIDGCFSEMEKEAKNVFDKGGKAYWLTLMFNVVTWQFYFMGTVGMVLFTCSLTWGVRMTMLMTVNVLGGVIVFGDNFGEIKIVSTLLSFWRFSSYLYGVYIKTEEEEEKMKDGSLEKLINNDDDDSREEMTKIVTHNT